MTGDVTSGPVRVRGVAEAMGALRSLERKAKRRVVTKAVRAGAKVQRNTARSRVPVDTGQLKKQLRTSVKRDKGRGTVTATLKVKRTKGQKRKGVTGRSHVIRFLTEGVPPHVIPGPSRLGANTWVRDVQHPGIQPNPFMERAANASAHTATQDFTKVFGRAIEAEARKGQT